MANVKSQIQNKAQEAKTAAAAAVTVPQLRAAVENLADAVVELQAQVDRLNSRSS